MYHVVLTLAWFLGPIYATIPLFALFVGRVKKFLHPRRPSLYLIIPFWFVMMAVVYLVTLPWREAVLYHSLFAWLASVFLFAIAILIYVHSRLHFSRIQVIGHRQAESAKDRRLVTAGIRQHVRHPVYLAHLCMLLAWTVGSGEIVLYGLTMFALLTGWPMIRQEEAELEDWFGDEYRTYKRAVPAALVPRVFRFAKTRQH